MRRTLYKAERIDGDLVTADDPRHSKHEEAEQEAKQRDAARRSAEKVRGLLEEAKEHGHYVNGWYAYIDKADVERLVAAVLG
jgi:hypothetical protein